MHRQCGHVDHRKVQTSNDPVKHLDLSVGVLGFLVSDGEVRPYTGQIEVRRALDGIKQIMKNTRRNSDPMHPRIGLDVDLEGGAGPG